MTTRNLGNAGTLLRSLPPRAQPIPLERAVPIGPGVHLLGVRLRRNGCFLLLDVNGMPYLASPGPAITAGLLGHSFPGDSKPGMAWLELAGRVTRMLNPG